MIELINKVNHFFGKNTYLLNAQIKDTLIKSSTARNKSFDLTTIISRDLFEDIKRGKAEGKLLVGKRYKDRESGITFDVLTMSEDFKYLENIDCRKTPIVPYFKYGSLKNPKEHFLLLSNSFPEIDKILMSAGCSSPVLYKLDETDSKKKAFTLRSYKVLNGSK